MTSGWQRIEAAVQNPVGKSPIEIPNVGRKDLAEWCAHPKVTISVEVGVETGNYTEVICKANPQGKLYAVDAWAAYPGYREHVSQEKLDGFYAETQARMAPYNCELVRMYSVDASRGFEDRSIDFLYIDANHTLPQVIADLAAWTPKVKIDGIVSGHDYTRRIDNGYNCHVVDAITAWTRAYHVSPWFLLGSKDIVRGETRDRPRSWMWINRGR